MRRHGVVSITLLLLASCLLFATTAHEVPTKKAMPPLMDPIPTLPEITHRVYFEIEIEGKSAGKIVFGLFGKNAPQAAENFRALAVCDRGTGPITGKPLCFKNTNFHRIIPNFALQGGDITHGDGSGGESIYATADAAAAAGGGGRYFAAEMKELVKFNRPHMLAAAAPSTPSKYQAGSQFFVTTVKAQWLTGKHVIFGTVLEGKDVLEEMEEYGTYGGKPRAVVKIVGCGEEPLQKEDLEPHY